MMGTYEDAGVMSKNICACLQKTFCFLLSNAMHLKHKKPFCLQGEKLGEKSDGSFASR